MEWVGILIGGVLGGGGLGALLIFIATRKRDAATDIAERFDDASELAKYIDERVEAKVKPVRDRLAEVEEKLRQNQSTVRAWISTVWAWARRGKPGDVPMPPESLLAELGLDHFIDEWPTEPIQPR